jgi:hypothetical protein
MVKVWIIKPHFPGDFPHTLITIKDGRRYTEDFVRACQNLSFVSSTDINNNDEFIALCSEVLELNDNNRASTVDISKDIQACYMQDYVYYINDLVKEKGEEYLPKGVVHNYFATLTNINGDNVYGNAVLYKVDGKKLIDLEGEELFEHLSNFYYLKTYQVRGGELVEITFPNVEPIVAEALKDKRKHVLDLWEFYIGNDVEMTDLGIKPVDIKDYEGLIVLKRKENMSLVWKAIEDLKKTRRADDLRGLYEDVNKEYIKGFFS